MIPTCSKCGTEHWNFARCEGDKRSNAQLQLFEHPERRGLRNFGDRLDGVDVRGNVHWLTDGPIKPRGGVIEPEEWGN